MMARKKVLPVLVCLCALVAARADQSFTINLDGSQETPPNASTGSGSGTAFFDSTALTITLDVNFIDLLDAATAAHSCPAGSPEPDDSGGMTASAASCAIRLIRKSRSSLVR